MLVRRLFPSSAVGHAGCPLSASLVHAAQGRTCETRGRCSFRTLLCTNAQASNVARVQLSITQSCSTKAQKRCMLRGGGRGPVAASETLCLAEDTWPR
eukprot:363999-Chlamydomonas_euryale.AAC.2